MPRRGRARWRRARPRTWPRSPVARRPGRSRRGPDRSRPDVGYQGGKAADTLIDLAGRQRAARQPDRVAAAAVQIEEARRRPEHSVVPRREFEQLLVSAYRYVEYGEEAAARRVPGDRRVAEVMLERGQQRAQVAPVERDLLPVRGAQAVAARHQKA